MSDIQDSKYLTALKKLAFLASIDGPDLTINHPQLNTGEETNFIAMNDAVLSLTAALAEKDAALKAAGEGFSFQIASLQAELAEKDAEVERLTGRLMGWEQSVGAILSMAKATDLMSIVTQRDSLAAENKRLREALTELLAGSEKIARANKIDIEKEIRDYPTSPMAKARAALAAVDQAKGVKP